MRTPLILAVLISLSAMLACAGAAALTLNPVAGIATFALALITLTLTFLHRVARETPRPKRRAR